MRLNIDPAEVKTLYEAGWGTAQIAKRYNVGQKRLYNFMVQHKIKTRTKAEAWAIGYQTGGMSAMNELIALDKINQNESEQVLNLTPTTARGKTMEALEIKAVNEKEKDIIAIQNISHRLANEIELLKEQKLAIENAIQRLDSDIRNTGALSIFKKKIKQQELVLEDLKKQEIEEEIQKLTVKWVNADKAFAMMSKIVEIDDAINGFQKELNALRGCQIALKRMINNFI